MPSQSPKDPPKEDKSVENEGDTKSVVVTVTVALGTRSMKLVFFPFLQANVYVPIPIQQTYQINIIRSPWPRAGESGDYLGGMARLWTVRDCDPTCQIVHHICHFVAPCFSISE